MNRQPVDAICRVVHTSQAERLARQWVSKFKEHVERQMFGKLFIILSVHSSGTHDLQNKSSCTNETAQKLSYRQPPATAFLLARLSSRSERTCLPSSTRQTSRGGASCSRSRKKAGKGYEPSATWLSSNRPSKSFCPSKNADFTAAGTAVRLISRADRRSGEVEVQDEQCGHIGASYSLGFLLVTIVIVY